MEFVTDLGLAKVIGSALIAVVTVLGGAVTFFLGKIYARFATLIDDVNDIRMDVALLKQHAGFKLDPDDGHTNGARHRKHRDRGGFLSI